MEGTVAPVKALSKAIRMGSIEAAVAALSEIRAAHPQAWKFIMARGSVLSDPARVTSKPENYETACSTLWAAAESLRRSGQIESADLQWIRSFSAETLRASRIFDRLRAFLPTLTFFQDSLATQTFRLGVFLEHQARMAQLLAFKHGVSGDVYDPRVVIGDRLQVHGGGNTSILGGFESSVEAVELALRYAHRVASEASQRGILVVAQPFGDPDFERLLRAAAVWRQGADTLGAVRFGGWSTHSGDDHACYSPSDRDEYVRREIGRLREQSIMAEFLSQEVLPSKHSDTLETLTALAKSMTVPNAGQTWDGKLSAVALSAAAANTGFHHIAAGWAQFRHFEPYVRTVAIPPSGLRWSTWLDGCSVLHTLANAMAMAVHHDNATLPSDLTASVVVCLRCDLVNALINAGVPAEHAGSIVDALTFSPNRRALELWDQPLLPLGPDRILLAPGLVQASSPIRMLENSVEEWGEASPGMRGPPFERSLADEIGSQCPGAVQRNVVFTDAAGQPVECDIVWWWDEFLFLIETKCLKSWHSDAEFVGSKRHIEEAFSQLERRRAAVRGSWDSFRASAQDCKLPAESPDEQRIITLVLTNVLGFTGWETAGSIAVDDVLFRRYFGDPAIHVGKVGQDTGIVLLDKIGQIRLGEPAPPEFLAYLRNAPQVASIKEHLSLVFHQSTAAMTDFPVWMMHAEYEQGSRAT